MNKDNSIFQQVIDNVDQGIILIDEHKKFKELNEKAKEILGITSGKTTSHPGGKISPGDIVIICDNCIGYDDGELTPEDLSLISINDKNIKIGDMFVCVGVYKNKEIKPIYKNLPNNHLSGDLTIKTNYLNFQIESSILSKEKTLSIKVNDSSYNMSYMNSTGHIVIIDGMTGLVKFFQTKGYTIRGEDLKYILLGKEYLPQGKDTEAFNIIGMNYGSVIGDGDLSKLIEDVFNGDVNDYNNGVFYINKIIVLCSAIPICENGKTTGVMLKIIDISELELLMKLRNNTVEEIEKVYTSFQNKHEDYPEHFLENIIGTSDAIKRIKYYAFRSTKTESNIIITGESGTGKSQLAYEIHKYCRSDSPFVEVNCNAIAPTLFESELFGYVAGAFTGALSKGKIGYFEKANGGTIFLDEIGDLPLDMQVKLLNVLQSKTIYRVGSSTPIKVDVRVIAATNKDLLKAVKEKCFRQDLYYRLNVFPISIPPLRERKSDIYLLINRITRRLCESYNMNIKQFSGAALSKLINYEWPGNIRELENVIEHAIAITEGDIIYPEYVDISSNEEEKTLKAYIEEAERKALSDTLISCGGDKNKAINVLNISRASFYDKLKKYGLD